MSDADREKSLARFFAKVNKTDGCWEWSACKYKNGYGAFYFDGKVRYAHRFAYEALVGPIPLGLEIDHLCRNRSCVNPSHLEPVTRRENMLRGLGPAASNARRTACVAGHPFTPENTKMIQAGNGRMHRDCRACHRNRVKEYNKRQWALGGTGAVV